MQHTKSRWISQRKRSSLLFMLPALLLLLCFLVLPALYGFGTSFTFYNSAMPSSAIRFVGFDNYRNVLTDSYFQSTVAWTLVFSLISVVSTVLLGLLIALALGGRLLGRAGRAYKAIFILPMMLAPIVVSSIWYLLFAPIYGLINVVLAQLGLPSVSWLGDATAARAAVLIADLWMSTPFCTIILLAGLTTVPTEMYESASLEGAGAFAQFRLITLPMIRTFLGLIVSMRMMDSLRVFDIIYVLTKGGPERVTETMGLYIYRTAFRYFDVGKGSAASFLLFLLIAAITFVYMRLMKTTEASEL